MRRLGHFKVPRFDAMRFQSGDVACDLLGEVLISACSIPSSLPIAAGVAGGHIAFDSWVAHAPNELTCAKILV